MHLCETCLWFDHQAEEAAEFYTSVFERSRIACVVRNSEGTVAVTKGAVGSVLAVLFELDGRPFMALNGGPAFTHSPAVSFAVGCETQDELDGLWERLSDGGQTMECGWLTDKYGITWQIWPAKMSAMMQDSDRAKAERAMQAVWTMQKLDIAAIEAAYQG